MFYFFTDEDLNSIEFYEGDIDLPHSFPVGVDLADTGDIDGKKIDPKRVEDAIVGRKRNALRYREYLWNNKTVPYKVDPSLGELVIRVAVNSCVRYTDGMSV